MTMNRHPDSPIRRTIDELAQELVEGMSPLQIGLLRYPSATSMDMNDVPKEVIRDHLSRYSMEDLSEGQFLEVSPGKYTFFMGQNTKKCKDLQTERDGGSEH